MDTETNVDRAIKYWVNEQGGVHVQIKVLLIWALDRGEALTSPPPPHPTDLLPKISTDYLKRQTQAEMKPFPALNTFIYSSAICDPSIFQRATCILQCVHVGHIVNDYQPDFFNAYLQAIIAQEGYITSTHAWWKSYSDDSPCYFNSEWLGWRN